jgi:hypothetical protein
MSIGVSHAQGQLIAQVIPGVTSAVNLFTATNLRMEITLLIAVIHSGTAGNIEIEFYHDDDGTTYDNTTLIASIQRADNADGLVFQAQHPGSGILIARGGSIGVKISTASVVTFSAYGITETLAERVRSITGQVG